MKNGGISIDADSRLPTYIGMYLDSSALFVTNFLLLFRLALAIRWTKLAFLHSFGVIDYRWADLAFAHQKLSMQLHTCFKSPWNIFAVG